MCACYYGFFRNEERVWCLNDPPTAHPLPALPSKHQGKLPGEIFSGDDQCVMQYGNGWRLSPYQPVNMLLNNMNVRKTGSWSASLLFLPYQRVCTDYLNYTFTALYNRAFTHDFTTVILVFPQAAQTLNVILKFMTLCCWRFKAVYTSFALNSSQEHRDIQIT